MNLHEHCNLCDNTKTNLQDGVTCGLTDKKPAFNNICSKIKISKKTEERIGLVHIEIERLKKQRVSIYISSFLYVVIGSILILSQKSYLLNLPLLIVVMLTPY